MEPEWELFRLSLDLFCRTRALLLESNFRFAFVGELPQSWDNSSFPIIFIFIFGALVTWKSLASVFSRGATISFAISLVIVNVVVWSLKVLRLRDERTRRSHWTSTKFRALNTKIVTICIFDKFDWKLIILWLQQVHNPLIDDLNVLRQETTWLEFWNTESVSIRD